jgi:thiol:disulfide interchange protein DsbD
LGFPRSPQPQDLTWEPWSESRVSELRRQGRAIYVDFTARWCATCQTNKKLVFGSEDVQGTVRMLNVALLKADWTNSDPAITRELARWNRSAVPFDLVYLPGESQPRILPELLTPSIVLEALSPKAPVP